MEVDLKHTISLRMSFIYYGALACEKSTLFSFLELQVHIFAATTLNHTLDLSFCLNRQYVCSDFTNPGRIKCPKTDFQAFHAVFFFHPAPGRPHTNMQFLSWNKRVKSGQAGRGAAVLRRLWQQWWVLSSNASQDEKSCRLQNLARTRGTKLGEYIS